jgi:CBS-domain-containing membrane protein
MNCVSRNFDGDRNLHYFVHTSITKKKTPWSESTSELYRPSDRRFSAKLLPTFADRGCHVVSVTDPYGRILGFLDRSRYFSIK